MEHYVAFKNWEQSLCIIWSDFQIMHLNETTKMKGKKKLLYTICHVKMMGVEEKRDIWSLVQNNCRKGDPQTKEMIYLQERKWVHDTYVYSLLDELLMINEYLLFAVNCVIKT